MTNQYFVAAVVAVLLLGAPAKGQSAADLLQKGIHAQETVGDVDGAIQIFRQVAASPTANKVLAAQAQYQLVVCMLQKGDRAAARKELDLLARNFPDQADLATKARKLVATPCSPRHGAKWKAAS
jgi:outer membrane protein assembly factor BamD (BamD/ComL family)